MNSSPWPCLTLGQLTSSTRPICYGVLKPGPYVPDGIPLLRIVDLVDDRVSDAAVHRISADLDTEFSRSRLRGGEVLLSIQGTVGRVAICPPHLAGANISRTLAVIEPDDRVLPAFLRYYLMSVTAAHRYETGGTTRASLNISTIRAMPVPVPSPEDQRRIVEILEDHLSRLEAASQLLSGSLAHWGMLWHGAGVSALTGRHLAAETDQAPELWDQGVDDGVLPLLPAGWRWHRLGDLADVVGGVTKDAAKQSDPAFVRVPYLRVANVQRGFLDLAHVTTIRVPQLAAERLRLVPGDVLLNEGGDRDKLGRGWVWEGQVDDCIHQNHVFRARVRDCAIDPYLLSWAANLIGGRWCERNGRQSVNLASISLSKIRLMPVPVPPRAEQAAIAARLRSLLASGDRLRTEVRVAVTRTDALRRSLLAAAFGGKLTESSLDRELARELAGV